MRAITAREKKVTYPVDRPLMPKNRSVITVLFTKILIDKINKKVMIAIEKVLFKKLCRIAPRKIQLARATPAVSVSKYCFGEDTGSYDQLGRITTVTRKDPKRIKVDSQVDFVAMVQDYQLLSLHLLSMHQNALDLGA
jgi:hypothetical protein